jgi:hypothetical protein
LAQPIDTTGPTPIEPDAVDIEAMLRASKSHIWPEQQRWVFYRNQFAVACSTQYRVHLKANVWMTHTCMRQVKHPGEGCEEHREERELQVYSKRMYILPKNNSRAGLWFDPTGATIQQKLRLPMAKNHQERKRIVERIVNANYKESQQEIEHEAKSTDTPVNKRRAEEGAVSPLHAQIRPPRNDDNTGTKKQARKRTRKEAIRGPNGTPNTKRHQTAHDEMDTPMNTPARMEANLPNISSEYMDRFDEKAQNSQDQPQASQKQQKPQTQTASQPSKGGHGRHD